MSDNLNPQCTAYNGVWMTGARERCPRRTDHPSGLCERHRHADPAAVVSPAVSSDQSKEASGAAQPAREWWEGKIWVNDSEEETLSAASYRSPEKCIELGYRLVHVREVPPPSAAVTVSKEAVEWLEKTRDTWTREWGVHRLTWPEEILAALDGPEPVAGGESVETSARIVVSEADQITLHQIRRDLSTEIECERIRAEAQAPEANGNVHRTIATRRGRQVDALQRVLLAIDGIAPVVEEGDVAAQADSTIPQGVDTQKPTSLQKLMARVPFPSHFAVKDILNGGTRVYFVRDVDAWFAKVQGILGPQVEGHGETSQAQPPQKQQPDDVPRAGDERVLLTRIIRASRRENLSPSFVALLDKAYEYLCRTPSDILRALPTNAEAQAPVSAEAMEWLKSIESDGWDSYKPHAREILATLRTLGATPAQTKP